MVRPLRGLAYALAIVGLLFVVVGVIYLVVPIRSLPGFLPGHTARLPGYRWKRGATSLAGGLVFWGGAVVSEMRTTAR